MDKSIIYFIYKCSRVLKNSIHGKYSKLITWWKLKGNGVKFSNFSTGGIPHVMVARHAKGMTIGKNFAMNNGISHNPIGCPQPCTFFVDNGASITIGKNVGISQTALIAVSNITIGDNVKIGGGTCIYTSDFHSLNPRQRNSNEDMNYRISKPVIIEDNAFIGAHCIILKGVTIGENSIVGAGSIVSKSIPANQIWVGNPARFIRNI